jgi:hypothetical protein
MSAPVESPNPARTDQPLSMTGEYGSAAAFRAQEARMKWHDVMKIASGRGAHVDEIGLIGKDWASGRIAVEREVVLGKPAIAVLVGVCSQRRLSADVALAMNSELSIGAMAILDGSYVFRCVLLLDSLVDEQLAHIIDTAVLVGRHVRALFTRPDSPPQGMFVNFCD